MKVGQKDPCPCGSGKKYKHCHAKIDLGKRRTSTWVVPAGVFVVGIGLIYFVSHGKGASPVSTSAPMPLPATTTAQPVTTPTTSTSTSTSVTAQNTQASKDQSPLPGGATPQPWQYDAPRKRYWHPAHAHWHDGTPPPPAERAAEMSQAGSRAADQSPLPGGVMPTADYYDASKDRYWSAEHAHWHTGHPPTAVSSPTVTATPAPATKTP